MTATLLVIHILLAIGLIAVILVQRSSSDGGGLMGGSGGSSFGGLMSVRGTANLLTRVTSFLATAFIATSILLTILGGSHHRPQSVLDRVEATPPAVPAAADKATTDTAPKVPSETTPNATETPAAPSVPVSK
jgi:preprotein translocase subunit SecG